MEYGIWNGESVPRHEIVIDLEDRGYQFGDGIYEVIGVYSGKHVFMEEHLIRLERSAKEMDITIPFHKEELRHQLNTLLEMNQLKEGIIYIQMTRGIASRTHQFPDPTVYPTFIAYTKEVELPISLQEKGAKTILTDDLRWLRCDIKSLNLLGNVLAKQMAYDQEAFEATLHRNGTVTEGSSTNVFMVKDEVVYTHPANNFILNGITRLKVLELCDQLKIQVVERSFSIGQLREADEVFITGTKIDIIPVIEISGQKVSSGKPGFMTKKLQHAFENLL